METKIDYLIDEVRSLKQQIQKLIVQQNYTDDACLSTYFQNKTDFDFADKPCRECLNAYLEFKNTLSPFIPDITQYMFNRLVKKVFPTLKVSTASKNRKCVQIFKRRND